MTLNEIIVAALQQMKRGRDQQTIDTYRASYTQYANMAQQDLAKSFPLYRTDAVDAGIIVLHDLPRWPVKVISITQNGQPVPWDLGAETGLLNVTATGEVDVQYRCLPAPLQDSTDEPELPKQLHQCIVSYVVGCDRSEGDPSTQGGASLYFQLYNQQKRALMRGGVGAPSTYKINNMERW